MKEKLIKEIKIVDEKIVRNMHYLAYFAKIDGMTDICKKIALDTEKLFEFRAKFSYILANQFKIYGM